MEDVCFWMSEGTGRLCTLRGWAFQDHDPQVEQISRGVVTSGGQRREWVRVGEGEGEERWV